MKIMGNDSRSSDGWEERITDHPRTDWCERVGCYPVGPKRTFWWMMGYPANSPL